MTNWEWLEALANSAPCELQVWFDSEHVENANATVDGDTAALNAKIAALTAELDSARRDRETYRELLGKAIDFAFDITLLLDEGAA